MLVQHDLQDGGNRCTGRLLQPRRALAECVTAGFPIGLVEQGFAHPSVQRTGPNSNGASGIVHALAGQEREDCLLLFWAQFTAISCHFCHPGSTPSLILRPGRFIFRKSFTFRYLRGIHVMTAQSAAPRRTIMTTFTIDQENAISAFATAEEAAAATATPFDSFSTEQELVELAAQWPVERLVAILNSLPGE